LANQLKEDKEFYELCSNTSKELYKKHYTKKVWLKEMKSKL